MKKQTLFILLALTMVLTLSACNNNALAEAKAAADSYNEQAAAYNERIVPYNNSVQAINEANDELETALNSAQDVLNQGQTPYDPETIAVLKSAMTAAENAKVPSLEALPEYETLAVDENAKASELKALTKQAQTRMELMNGFTVPDISQPPDYTAVLSTLHTARQAYEDSVQSMLQITAPSDAFVLERLRKIETVTAIEAVTENHDPNGMLNKQGGYIGCVYFTDTRVNREHLYIEPGKDNVIDVGCNGGGAVEIYNTAAEAEARNVYLGSFDGSAFRSGSHYVVGTMVIRTSNELTGSQQLDLTDQITQALTQVQ